MGGIGAGAGASGSRRPHSANAALRRPVPSPAPAPDRNGRSEFSPSPSHFVPTTAVAPAVEASLDAIVAEASAAVSAAQWIRRVSMASTMSVRLKLEMIRDILRRERKRHILQVDELVNRRFAVEQGVYVSRVRHLLCDFHPMEHLSM